MRTCTLWSGLELKTTTVAHEPAIVATCKACGLRAFGADSAAAIAELQQTCEASTGA